MAKRNHYMQKSFLKILHYVLARRPDEFGLVPDPQGYVSLKELIKSMNEDEEWRYVRKAHIHELLLGEGRAFFELSENRIRAVNREWQDPHADPSAPLPKILLSPVRRRAHQYVFSTGLKAHDKGWIVLTPDRLLAERIGKRKDPQPVILEVLAQKALSQGVQFFRFGTLFLAREIPPLYIGGPQPEPEDKTSSAESPRRQQRQMLDLGAGSFVLDVKRDPDPSRRQKGRKPKGWKEQVRKSRKRGKR